jgi:carboxylate-amine ligase
MPQTMRNWSEYVWLINHLIRTKFISSIREIWWDVRPHGGFGTVEVRVMDMPINMRHTLGMVALCQSLIAGISDQIDRGAYLYDCHPMIARQNKWHASRYGMDATFVDPDTMKAVPARELARRLIELCSPYAEKLGCLEQLGYLHDIIDHGTGAERQRAAFERSGDLREVVRYMIVEGQQALA